MKDLTLDELRHVYRRKLLALDRRREPRPHFWIRAAALERICAVNAGNLLQDGERKAKQP